MTDVKKPLTEVDVDGVLAQAQKTGNIEQTQFFALLNVLVAKEARLAKKEADLELAFQQRDEQAKRESEQYTVAMIENQKRCKHLKGGKGRTRGQQKDPAVYLHTFTDGTPQVKCMLCRAKWFKKDTDEYLERNGSKIPNWTGIGWRRALEMVEDSSNKPSSSERFGSVEVTSEAPKSKSGALVPNLQL